MDGSAFCLHLQACMLAGKVWGSILKIKVYDS